MQDGRINPEIQHKFKSKLLWLNLLLILLAKYISRQQIYISRMNTLLDMNYCTAMTLEVKKTLTTE